MGVLSAIAVTLLVASQAGDFDARARAADALERSGKLDAALDAYRALVDAAPDPERRGEVLVALALVHNRRGEYDAARRRAEEAASTFRTSGNLAREASARNVAGLADLYSGEYVAAQATFRAAAALAERAHDGASHAELLSNLGNTFFFQGRYDEASRAYSSAVRVVQQHAQAAWAPRRERIIRLNQAALNQRLGRYQAALVLYKAEASDAGLRPDEQAQALVNQGALYRRLGDPLKALAAYEAAQQLFAGSSHADGELGALINRGIVYALDLQNLSGARRMFQEAARRAEKIGSRREKLQADLYRAELELRAGSIDAAERAFATSVTAATELETPEETWKALYGLGRIAARRNDRAGAARLFERAIAVIEGLRDDLRLGAGRADFFQDKRDVYDALIRARLDDGNVAELFALVERARARVWRDRLRLPTVSLSDVQQVLDPQTLLLEYWSSPLGAAVLTVTSKTAKLDRLPDLSEDTVLQLARVVATPGSDWRPAAAALTNLLLPRDAIREGIRRVIVIADGALSLVPFDVLQVDGGPLVRHVALSQTPAASALLRPSASRSRLGPPWKPVLTVFADPQYAATGEPNDEDEIPPPLPASAREAQAIASQLAGHTRLYLGAQNRKSGFLDRSDDRSPVVHVASHALVQQPLERSRVLFSSEGPGRGPEALFLREIYEADLGGTELAVLSACDTERGEFVRGEGVQSFSRALLAAGVESTITTLWKVPDELPVGFMTVLYHRLQQGDARDEALRQAKLAMLASGDVREHPHYWAPFVLSGAPDPISRALPWSSLLAGVLGSIALALAASAARRRSRKEK